jgi:hypothetical protein
MAKRGSTKALSVEQEDYVAKTYGGKRSKSSGGADHDQGDVRVADQLTLFECKGQFGERTGKKPVRSTLVKHMEKVADEAWSEGKDPALALRFYMPESKLSNDDGYVDFSVRMLLDDAYNMAYVREYREEHHF